ncbi:MAG TPA: PEP-CTERM sorting domain-containing protein, partial [Verrucomicrobiota bacterium]|nr:PEP-CTERM sorting domain-containing protein [Verrucomicrobiota bacterium]
EGAEASSHLVRLWAKDEIRRLAASRMTEEAVGLAGRYQWVTPVSGAVVLETAQQYRSSELEPVPPSTVPSIPEPSTWALLALGTGFLLFARRRPASVASS